MYTQLILPGIFLVWIAFAVINLSLMKALHNKRGYYGDSEDKKFDLGNEPGIFVVAFAAGPLTSLVLFLVSIIPPLYKRITALFERIV